MPVLPLRRTTYGNRLRGPLLDRVDIQVFVPAASRRTLALEPGEPSAVVARRVAAARAVAASRWSGTGARVNAHVPSPVLRQARFRLPGAVTRDLDRAMDRTLLTMRGYVRCLRLAWTAADLRGADRPGRDDVGLALLLRHEDTELAA